VIPVEPIDDLDCAVDRLEIALLQAVDKFRDHALEPRDLQPGEFLGRGDQRLRSSCRRMFSVRFRVSCSVALISSTPAPATSEASTLWARVAFERFDRVDRFVSDMGRSSRDLLEGSARAGERRPRFRAAFGLLASGEVFGRDKERRLRARVSNLPYYAVTGV
jgi:hypothetical protein